MRELLDRTYVSTWATMVKITQRALFEIERELAEQNLISLTWYDVIYAVYSSEGQRLRLSDLTQEVILSKSALSRSVDKIVKSGLLKKRPCSEDARASWLEITTSGKEALRHCWVVYEAGIRKYFVGHLTVSDTREIAKLLKKAYIQECV